MICPHTETQEHTHGRLDESNKLAALQRAKKCKNVEREFLRITFYTFQISKLSNFVSSYYQHEPFIFVYMTVSTHCMEAVTHRQGNINLINRLALDK